MVLRLTCTTLEDALDVAAGRLAVACPGVSAPRLVAKMKRREEVASSMVGNGVAMPYAFVENAAPIAAVVTLAKPLHAETPDRAPLRLLVTLVGGERGRAHLVRMAHVARLSSHGLAERLADVEQPQQLLARLTELEALR
jgi:PTS system nitrogen regulatory IIA component